MRRETTSLGKLPKPREDMAAMAFRLADELKRAQALIRLLERENAEMRAQLDALDLIDEACAEGGDDAA